MKKILFSLLLLCAALPAQAMTHPEQGQFGFYAEWLYMSHSIDNPYFVINNSTVTALPVGTRQANNQNWKSGYRVEGIWAFCDRPNDLRVRWTHFPTFHDTRSISDAILFGTLNDPNTVTEGSGTASINDRYNVWTLDVLLGQKAIYCGPFALDLQAGLQYANVSWRETVDYPFALGGDVLARSKIWGIGPEIGMDFSYALFNCFEFTGRASAGLLVSKRDVSWANGSSAIDVNNSKYWGVMPTTNLRFGLAYHYPLNCGSCGNWFACLGNLDLDIEIGYEVMTYYKGVDRIRFVNNVSQGVSFDELMDLTLHGPYLHLGVAF